MIYEISKEGVVGMEVVEVAPPYDVSDITALLGVHAILNCLAGMINGGKLGTKDVPAEERTDQVSPVDQPPQG
jgi:hypothetical protein